MTKKAAIYVRVSSERQAAEDRVSIEAQLQDCEDYCKQKGYLVVGRFVDKEKYRVKGALIRPSGQRKDRPGYQKMLKAAGAGEVDVIVAWKEDRLYRGMYAAMPLAELLDERGKNVEVELVRETFDRRMLGIKAALGKIEVDNIRERMVMGRRVRLERGEVPGGNQVKYGYKKVEKHLEIEEPEAMIVQKIYEWYIMGESFKQMRQRLEATGLSPRKAKNWNKAMIQNVLSGEFYATGKMETELDGETYLIPCPPIISMETWQKSVAVRQDNINRFKPRNVKEDYLCLGILHCVCGWKCQGRNRKSNANRGYDKAFGEYVCQKKEYSVDPANYDRCIRTISSARVDNFVWNFVRQVCANPDVVRKAIDDKVNQLTAEQSTLETEVTGIQNKLNEISMERQWVITQARKGRITDEDMDLQLGQMQLQEWSLRKDLDQYQAGMIARQQVKAVTEWADRYLGDIHQGIQSLDVDLKKLTPKQEKRLYEQMEAWRFKDKFPGDEKRQLFYAVVEEKRRIVRMLIEKVYVGRTEDGVGRIIVPVLSLDIPVENAVFLGYGDQSLSYIEQFGAVQELVPAA